MKSTHLEVDPRRVRSRDEDVDHGPVTPVQQLFQAVVRAQEGVCMEDRGDEKEHDVAAG